MKSKTSYIFGIIAAVVSVFLIVGLKLIFPVCGIHDDGTYGLCHSTGQIAWYMAIAMTAVWILFIIIKNKIVDVILSIVGIVLAVVTALIPGTICRLCVMPGMRCISTMKPCTIACGAVLACLGIICLIASLKGSKANEK